MLEGYVKFLRSMYSLTATARSGHSPDLKTAVLMLGGFQYMNLLTLLFAFSVLFDGRLPNIPRWGFVVALAVVYAVNILIVSRNRRTIEQAKISNSAMYSKRPAFIYAAVSTGLMACVVMVMAASLAMR